MESGFSSISVASVRNLIDTIVKCCAIITKIVEYSLMVIARTNFFQRYVLKDRSLLGPLAYIYITTELKLYLCA